jgi:hypothetical protein
MRVYIQPINKGYPDVAGAFKSPATLAHKKKMAKGQIPIQEKITEI